MKKLLAMLLACLMVLSLAACGGNDSGSGDDANTPAADNNTPASDDGASGEAGGTFKIGGHGPLTGGAAIYGNAAKNGAQIAVDEINAEGGAVQFELNYEDDEHDPEKAENAYNALKDWGMQLSLSGVTSKPAEATSTSHNDDRIFALTPSASSTAVVEGKDNVYQMCFMDPNQGTASADYIFDQKLGTKVAVIYQNDEVYSSGIYERFAARAEEVGLEIVSATTFTAASMTDFSVQLGEAKNAGADLLYLPIYYTPASLILTQAKGMGYEPKIFGVDGMDGILTVKGFDTSLAEGVMLLTPFNADAEDERTQKFVSTYKEQFGEVPNQFAADAYDCVYAFKQAIEETGATADMSAEDLCGKMIEAFTSMTFNGLTGEGMTWTDGAVSKSPKGMVIENGAYVGMD
ncbi:amino acid ABC transporter substrate-binding protein [Clostridiaceae bacterium]|nr:amino acid ABC transporter substrate-binding protein [Clostridiaceae bacterium]NBI82798.1 amino acid ABC transporter substrate-binding protein [Clostridiaceae bacterium]RKJ80730.1 amino acid ABC transporter substrate-binding protein [Butyricicoccus sp. 1XD8-22]